MSDAPHSAVTTVSPPSVRIRTRGTVRPVARSSRHVERAVARSRRASRSRTSASGASSRADGSTGSTRTLWPSRPRAGSAWAEPPTVGVSSSRSATGRVPPVDDGWPTVPPHGARSCSGVNGPARDLEHCVRAPCRDPRPGALMEAPTRAVLTAVLAALMAVASFTQEIPPLAHLAELPVIVAAGLMSLAIAAGWPLLLGLPNVLGSAVVIALGGAGAVLAVTATRGQPLLRNLPIVVALVVLLAFVNELARQDGRRRLVDSVAGTVTGVLVATASAGWVAAERTPGGTSLVVSGAVALAVAAAVSAVPLGSWLGAAVTTGSAVLAGAVMIDIDVLVGGFLGLATGILIAALHALFDRLPALRRKPAAGRRAHAA